MNRQRSPSRGFADQALWQCANVTQVLHSRQAVRRGVLAPLMLPAFPEAGNAQGLTPVPVLVLYG